MKSIRSYSIFSFLLFVLLCFGNVSYGQSKKYLITFQQRANLDSIETVFRQYKTPVTERPKIVLQVLQSISQKNYNKFYLKCHDLKQKSEIEDFEFYWIVNSLVITTLKPVPSYFKYHPDVELILDLDKFTFQPILPVEMKEVTSSQRAVGGVEPGLMAVNVRGLWDLGYTGQGRKLLSFDTGVWPSHPALGGRFLGDYFPLSQSWKGFFSPVPTDKSNSHGTHTIGTMAGLDPATADTIGLAYKSYFIATDPIVQNPADVLPWDVLMTGFQWALNPDGDINTSWDVPDVICNSWGRFLNDTSLCESIVSETLIALELAGIGVEFSAGNNGPGDTTIGAPSFINPTELNNFSVGAVNANVAGLPIASFSSRGPSICLSSGARQIKPEVVAPGVDVRSSVGQNSYALYSGTSMAGPHVAGAMLLLKEAFPYLPGTDIKEALYETAIDLGVPGEDNIYGRGMIDITAAFNYLLQNNTPVPPNTSAYDISIVSIETHNKPFMCTELIEPKVKIKNLGSMSITGVKCIQKLTGSAQAMENSFPNLQLNPQQDTVLSLPAYTNSFEGNNELQIAVKPLQNFTEADSINNYKIARYFYNPIRNVQFYEGFENGNLYDSKCYVINPDNSRTWDTVSTNGLGVGNHSACLKFTGYGPPNSQKDDLLLPRIQIPAGASKLTLSFDVAYQYKSATKNDSLFVLVSKDCGQTFFSTAYAGGRDSLATVIGTTPSIFEPSQESDWKNIKVPLNAYLGESEILLNFRGMNRSGGNLYIDNIYVYTGEQPIGLPDLSVQEFKIFPNPGNGIFTIQTSEITNPNSRLKIFDMFGRLIEEKYLKSGIYNEQIDMQKLSQGIYSVWLMNGNKSYVTKLMILGN